MAKNKFLTFVTAGICSLMIWGVHFSQAATETQFFPVGQFSDQTDADRANQAWYGKHLKALKESSIYGLRKDQKAVVIRFLCVRAYQNPFVIRVEKNNDGSGSLIFKESDKDGGYQIGKIAEQKTVKLSKKQMADFLEKMNEKQFFRMKNREDSKGGLDASRWLIEGLCDGNYHLVDRTSPDWGSFRHLGTMLIKLSGKKIENLD